MCQWGANWNPCAGYRLAYPRPNVHPNPPKRGQKVPLSDFSQYVGDGGKCLSGTFEKALAGCESSYSFRQNPKWVNTDKAQYAQWWSNDLITIVVMTLFLSRTFWVAISTSIFPVFQPVAQFLSWLVPVVICLFPLNYYHNFSLEQFSSWWWSDCCWSQVSSLGWLWGWWPSSPCKINWSWHPACKHHWLHSTKDSKSIDLVYHLFFIILSF